MDGSRRDAASIIHIKIFQVLHRIKKWAYAGFGITFISAAVAHVAVDGVNGQTTFPLIGLLILGVSYLYFHKQNAQAAIKPTLCAFAFNHSPFL